MAEVFEEDRREVIERAKTEGVGKFIVPSISLEQAKEVVELAESRNGVYGLVGIHPETVIKGQEEGVDKLTPWIKKRGVVGVGEIGLDFYWDKEKKSKEKQMRVFKKQLEMGNKLDVPVVIHMREAEKEMREIINSLDKVPAGQFHCWSGSKKLMDLVLDRGFYVSFAGNITYPKADRLRGLAKRVPRDRLLLETDSPYLSPQEKRGGRNEPANVIINARFLADLLGISEQEFFKQTRQNTKQLFNI